MTLGTKHPNCPVCCGFGGWDPATGVPMRHSPYYLRTKCMYCGGGGACPECSKGRAHPTEPKP